MTSEPRIDALYKRMHEIFSQVPEREKNTIVDISGPRMTIKFNRPKRYNAFTIDMYLSLSEAINKAQTNEKVKFIVLTG
jgi:enoyl-CoA hydratase/carnithine racemase